MARKPKRQDGRYEVKVSVPGKKRISVYGSTPEDAQRSAASLRKKLALGVDPLSERMPLGSYLTSWMESFIKPHRKPKTVRNYTQMIEHIPTSFKETALADLTVVRLRELVMYLESTALAPATKRNVFAVVRSALNQAWRDGMIEHNHIARVTPPKARETEIEPLTPEQARALLDLAKSDGLWAGPIVTTLCLGLRMGEVLGLTLEDLNLAEGTLRIDKQLQRYGKGILALEETKQRSRRVVKLPATLLDVMTRHLGLRDETRRMAASAWRCPIAVADGRSVEFLFTTSTGTPHNDSNLRRRLRALLGLAEIKHHRFHDLRHTAATMLIAAGVNPKAVQHFMGWKDHRMVDRYTHAVSEVMNETATALDRVLTAPRKAVAKPN